VSFESAALISEEWGTYPPVEAPIRQPPVVCPTCALAAVAASSAKMVRPSGRNALAITFVDSRVMVMAIS
jgi:hypothetical protein